MPADPVTLEVLRSAFRAICNESSALLARVAYAATITEGHDHSGALLTREGDLIAHGQRDQAAHLGTFEESVKTTIEHAEGFKHGDVYVFNDPYLGGVHLNDITVISPMYFSGEIFGYVASLAHHVDVGGGVPGEYWGVSGGLSGRRDHTARQARRRGEHLRRCLSSHSVASPGEARDGR